MTALLEAIGLKKHFGGVWATNGVDLALAEHELHALIGPNGAGKTTLIHLVSGSLRPDAGRLRLAGRDITARSMHERVAMGITRSFQISQVFSELTALENVRLAVQGRRSDAGSSFRFWRPASAEVWMIEEAEEWLGQVGLAEQAGCLARELAYGERRALELAMALATRPRILLLDEPMAGLGPEEAERMTHLLAALKGKLTMLLIEHDMEVVFKLADRLSVLVEGRILTTGTPETVRADPAVRRAYLGEERA
ncbi:MAG: ABC transporter ATP-binding protein [Rhodocyclaceae bacterium]|nr:ABC transporter ATP-binding protein [Rhodocyclaceae bacterium]